jgi:hypothetical protein
MTLAEAEHRRQLLNAKPSGKICVDICNQPPALPSEQTPGCDSSIDGGWLRGPRPQGLFSLKKRNGTRDVRTGSFAVTVARFVRGFHELRCDV